MKMRTVKVSLGYLFDDLKFCFISDKRFNERLFKKEKGYSLNRQTEPSTFTEKLIYLKEHYRNPLMTLCSDKYLVTKYLDMCDCSEIKKTIYGVYKSTKDIDFDSLPDRFFIRCNHMSGCNFVFDKKFDKTRKREIMRLLSSSLKHNWYHSNREWNYKDISPLIICEECLENPDHSPLIDYKFYCFSGVPKYWMVSLGELDHNVHNHKFDMNCNSIDFYFKKKSTLSEEEARRYIPNNFAEMVEYVKRLCKPFPHVRVDLYNIFGRIVFGELTFFSNSGVVNVISKEFETTIGSWILLDKYKKDLQ